MRVISGELRERGRAKRDKWRAERKGERERGRES
jgi:hypothetical protein